MRDGAACVYFFVVMGWVPEIRVLGLYGSSMEPIEKDIFEIFYEAFFQYGGQGTLKKITKK